MTSFKDIKAKCLREGVLYKDPDFRAIDLSIFFSKRLPRPFEWKRPTEIVQNPKFRVRGASRLDIQQGMLGNSWFLAAVSSLARHEKLLDHVVPVDQGFGSDYAGVFHFRFWQYGSWKDIVIDDRLPTYKNKLIFCHSPTNDEFWSALLEKAYAKLFGSYEALKGGQQGEAMEDMTGGISETYKLGDHAPQYMAIQGWLQRGALIGCSIAAEPNEIQAKLHNGLIKGHAYSVTGASKVHDVNLVRIRNPWGNEREWTGAWSDSSREWTRLNDAEKRDIGLTSEDDGEFWMDYDDFIKLFTTLEVCNLSPGDTNGRWTKKEYDGRWQRNVSDGGCRNFLDTFANNPQFVIDLEDTGNADKVTMLVQMMQKDRRKMKSQGLNNLTIGFHIYKVPSDHKKSTRLDRDFFAYNRSTARSPSFIDSRSIVGRYSLPPGSYCIVPSTFKPHEQGKFLLRTFIHGEAQTRELGDKTAIPERKVEDVRMSSAESKALDIKFKSVFDKLSGADQEIDVLELQQIMSIAFKEILGGRGVSKDACKTIIASIDEDKSGRLNFEEFKVTWLNLRKKLKIFKQFDKDNSGTVNVYELREALKAATGIHASNDLANLLVHRYESTGGGIRFDDFLMCATRIEMFHALFKKHQTSDKGKACFGLDEFILGILAS